METTVTPIQKLDLVLDFLANNFKAKPWITDGVLYTELVALHPELGIDEFGSDLIRILEKLIKDGNVDFHDTHFPTDAGVFGPQENILRRYKITFDGKLLSENGGYQQVLKSSETRKRWEDSLLEKGERNGEWLNFLTLILGIGTIALAVVEIVKLYKGK
jgi:hypothetical protein